MGEAEVERLTPPQRALLAAYLRELEVWNRRMNLTAVAAAATWWRHVGESLRLDAALGLASDAVVIDVGSGAGFPGVVLAAIAPRRRIVLLESDLRKAGFLTHAAGVCGLDSVEVVARRAEDAGHDAALRQRFDGAVSRAAAPPAVLCELALPLVRLGGVLGAVVGDVDPRDSAAAASACGGGAPELVAPGILRVAKVDATPDAYPRRAGIPSRRPITG
ncbi:MAG: 16S rRNA (guanine(527)-N(7))-methyltransferase RsmG [Candidatus Dormibacteria bacterium]